MTDLVSIDLIIMLRLHQAVLDPLDGSDDAVQWLEAQQLPAPWITKDLYQWTVYDTQVLLPLT
jgi:hypothetical protein